MESDDDDEDDLSVSLETFSTDYFLKKFIKIKNSEHRSTILKILQNLKKTKNRKNRKKRTKQQEHKDNEIVENEEKVAESEMDLGQSGTSTGLRRRHSRRKRYQKFDHDGYSYTDGEIVWAKYQDFPYWPVCFNDFN